jgi:hypothetical protein
MLYGLGNNKKKKVYVFSTGKNIFFPQLNQQMQTCNYDNQWYIIVKNMDSAKCQWLTSVILCNWDAEIRKIAVPVQPELKSSRDPISTEKDWVW